MIVIEAKVFFENPISEEAKTINNRHKIKKRFTLKRLMGGDDPVITDIVLDLDTKFGTGHWTQFLKKYDFQNVDDGVKMLYKACTISAEEFIELVGKDFDEAKEKSIHIQGMLDYRKKYGKGYTQIFDVKKFFKEVHINKIIKVELSVIELW